MIQDGDARSGANKLTSADHPAMLAQHPALPTDMERLHAKFTDVVDLDWVRRFQRGDDGVGDPAHDQLSSIEHLLIVVAYVSAVVTMVTLVLICGT